MTDAAIISGSLVDAKNVNTHKVMRLIIDVPAENALKVIAAFGWPTMVNPVSVAVARLNEAPAAHPLSGAALDDALERRAPKSPAQIAGYLSTLPAFHKFLQERFTDYWYNFQTRLTEDEKIAAACVRTICDVTSRADIKPNNTEWHALQLAFQLWQNHPELEDA
jgi:hypothetical protein